MAMEFKEWLRNNTPISERTILNYTRTIDRFFLSYDKPTLANINKFISDTTRKYRSYYIKYAFKHYLEFIGKENIYEKLVVIKERPKLKPGTYLPRNVLLNLVDNISDERYNIIALLQYLTGARAGDILRFTTDNLMIGNNKTSLRLHRTKGEKEHTVFIPQKYSFRITQYIKRRSKKYPFLEGQDNSENFRVCVDNNYRYYFDAVKKAAKLVGYPAFSTHDFRRNFAEDAFSDTGDLRITQNLLGHARLETTLKYIKKKVENEKLIETVESLRG